MTSIRETITSSVSLPYGASDYVNPVVDALTEREYQLAESITAAVVGHFGVAPEQVTSRLEGLGMAVRPAPEPEPAPVAVPETGVAEEAEAFLNTESMKAEAESEGSGDLAKLVKKLSKRVKKLEKLAERHGLSV